MNKQFKFLGLTSFYPKTPSMGFQGVEKKKCEFSFLAKSYAYALDFGGACVCHVSAARRRLFRSWVAAGLCIVACSATAVMAQTLDARTEKKMMAALADKNRPQADQNRDANRLPMETMAFFELRDDMRVLDIDPGGGYYTRLLAPVLKEKGKLYLALGTDYVKTSLLQQDAYKEVNLISESTVIAPVDGARHYSMGKILLNTEPVDLITLFRVYHVFDMADRMRLNRALYDALKPGGIYGVIDHTARHNQPESENNRRRMDPVMAIAEIQAAGFIFEDYSALHYRPQDSLMLEVGDAKVTGQTDRWTLKFRKPAANAVK